MTKKSINYEININEQPTKPTNDMSFLLFQEDTHSDERYTFGRCVTTLNTTSKT